MNFTDPTLYAALSIFFLTGLVRATFGFGDALIAMPLITLLLGSQIATPVVALVTNVVTMIILWGDWRKVDIRAARQLILASLIGIPFGLWLLKAAPEQIIKTILAIIIILFSLYRLLQPRLIKLVGDRWAFLFGFSAGILGGAYNTLGPPIIIYSTLRQWPPDRFRATLQGYFFPTGLLIVSSHGLSGLWTQPVRQLFLLSLPLIPLGILLGRKLAQYIPPARFDQIIYIILILLGILLLI